MVTSHRERGRVWGRAEQCRIFAWKGRFRDCANGGAQGKRQEIRPEGESMDVILINIERSEGGGRGWVWGGMLEVCCHLEVRHREQTA